MSRTYLDIFLRKFDEKGEIIDSNTELWNKIDDVITKSLATYGIQSIRKISDKTIQRHHFVIHLHGGDNGNGDWSDYLMQLKNIFVNLEEVFEKAWIIQIENDCLDDVHEVLIGVRS